MEIYIDVLFLVNVFMDTLILWITSVLDRRKVKLIRIAADGTAGAFIYCFFVVFAVRGVLSNALCGIISVGISILIVFKPQKAKIFFRTFAFSVLASFIVGGAFIAAFNFIDVYGIISAGIGAFSFKLMAVLTAVFYTVVKLIGGVIVSSVTKRRDFCTAKLYLNGRWVEFTVLMDTGNFLSEDSLGRKIVIAEFRAVRDILSAETQLLYLKKASPEKIRDLIKNDEELSRFFLVPFSSLGTESGSLTAYKLDYAEFFGIEKTTIKNAVVAVYNGNLSGSGSFSGIINPCILEG